MWSERDHAEGEIVRAADGKYILLRIEDVPLMYWEAHLRAWIVDGHEPQDRGNGSAGKDSGPDELCFVYLPWYEAAGGGKSFETAHPELGEVCL